MAGSKHTAALAYLAHVRTKEDGQPIAGLRDTRAVADHLQVTTSAARRILDRLYEQGLVDCYDERPLLWCISDLGQVRSKAEGSSHA